MDGVLTDEAETALAEGRRRTAASAAASRVLVLPSATTLASPATPSVLSPDECVRSDDPAVHTCVGMRCPFIEMNRDRTYVCGVTGICWSQQGINDPFTAGIISAIDDNGVRTCGVDPRSASRRRRDPRLASEQAMIVAHDLERSEAAEAAAELARASALVPMAGGPDAGALMAPAVALALALQTPSPRSGPVALTHTPEGRPAAAPRRRRAPDIEQLAALRRDAQDTLDKLTLPKARPATSSTAPAASAASAASAAPPPPVAGARAALEEALRAHVRRCQIAGRIPLLDDLHNIELNARCTVDVARRGASGRASAAQRAANHGQLRGLGATLVVALWNCVLRSPYMEHAKRASDNFRPFAAGVFFSMRRGVALADGAPLLVPRCGALADALPVVRAAHRGTPTHAVHLSHHRGVRTLLKCIASVPAEQAVDFFADALRAARALEAAVAGGGAR